MIIRRLFFFAMTSLILIIETAVVQACGWYAISACSRDYSDAEDAADTYGGYVVNTDDYENFAGGYYCSVVGPKTKHAAGITARRMRQRGAYDAYIKYSCQ